MKTTRHAVDYPYTREDLHLLFNYARRHDVENGGPYDARSAAINIWSHHWCIRATEHDSDTIGTLYADWVDPRIWQIECDPGFELDDLRRELGALEALALGKRLHGC